MIWWEILDEWWYMWDTMAITTILVRSCFSIVASSLSSHFTVFILVFRAAGSQLQSCRHLCAVSRLDFHYSLMPLLGFVRGPCCEWRAIRVKILRWNPKGAIILQNPVRNLSSGFYAYISRGYSAFPIPIIAWGCHGNAPALIFPRLDVTIIASPSSGRVNRKTHENPMIPLW